MAKIENLLTAQDVSTKLKVTPQYIRRLINEGKLIATRIGNQWVIEKEDLLSYVKKYDILIEPSDHERLSDDLPEIVALSFFSGAMGLDIGMSHAGINALLACEFNKYCRMTIAKNKPDIALIGDINNYTPEEILRFAKIPEGRKVDIDVDYIGFTVDDRFIVGYGLDYDQKYRNLPYITYLEQD